MYKLILSRNEVEQTFQSASMQTLIREVTQVFLSKNSEKVPIPFSCKVNARGQIVEMYLQNSPEDSWWESNHPVNAKLQVKVTALITREGVESSEDFYPLPDHMHKGDGSCWVAVKNGQVLDIEYMRTTHQADFKEHRKKALDRLKPQGRILDGVVTAKRFFPKTIRLES